MSEFFCVSILLASAFEQAVRALREGCGIQAGKALFWRSVLQVLLLWGTGGKNFAHDLRGCVTDFTARKRPVLISWPLITIGVGFSKFCVPIGERLFSMALTICSEWQNRPAADF